MTAPQLPPTPVPTAQGLTAAPPLSRVWPDRDAHPLTGAPRPVEWTG
ncbi:hypothetical protein [Deinococcus aquaticus]